MMQSGLWKDPMRRALLYALLLTGAMPSARGLAADQLETAPQPVIEVRETTLDGGTVEEGTAIKLQFVVRNTGSADLELTRVKPDCGCSIARWEKVIAPGKEG